jgi:hypothetical protein
MLPTMNLCSSTGGYCYKLGSVRFNIRLPEDPTIKEVINNRVRPHLIQLAPMPYPIWIGVFCDTVLRTTPFDQVRQGPKNRRPVAFDFDLAGFSNMRIHDKLV